MNRFMYSTALLLLSLFSAASQTPSQTLRIDYIFSGTDRSQEISLDEMSCFDGWSFNNFFNLLYSSRI